MGFPCGAEVLGLVRGDVSELTKALDAFRKAAQDALTACQKGHEAKKQRAKANLPVHFTYFPTGFD